MVRRLDSSESDFSSAFAALLGEKRGSAPAVDAQVASIIADVRENGDDALVALTKKYDRHQLDLSAIRMPAESIEKLADQADLESVEALKFAADRIRAFHERQRPEDLRYRDTASVELGMRWRPVAAAGLYVPGGTAAYPSSVLMNAIPAQVAGVARLVIATPTPEGNATPLVFAAARLLGIDEIYPIGGAQAIAALAYGTASVKPVDVVVGPGNDYVATAKKQVFGDVGIDMVAGPSEILVVADGGNDPRWIAADLLSQAEHDPVAQAILITDDGEFADAVAAEVELQLETLPRAEFARESWNNFGAIIVIADLDQAPNLVDQIAPEHLELAVSDPDELFDQINNVGAVFLGRHTPEAIGDYVAGPNHVLPTSQTARFASGLSVFDFLRRTNVIGCDAESLAQIGGAAVRLAEAESLDGHARSVSIRKEFRPFRKPL